MRRFFRPSPASVFLFIFGLGMIAQSLITHVIAHGGDTNLVHGCVKNSNGDIRIVGENDTCSGNETALDWSKNGGGGIGSFLTDQLSGYSTSQDSFDYRNFDGVNFTDSVFDSNSMKSASFVGVNFSGSDISGAGMDNTNFTDANFSNAIISGPALVENPNFTNANFTNADVTGTDLSSATVTGAIWSNTTCPDGTNSDNNGNTCEGHLVP